MVVETLDPDLAFLLAEAPTPQPLTPVNPLAAPAFLDGITEEKPKGGRKVYPQFPETDGIASSMAARSIELSQADEQLKSNNKLLGEHILPFWFGYWHKKAEVDSGIRVQSDKGPVLAVFTSRLKKMTSDRPLNSVRGIFGGLESKLFFWSFDLKIDSDEIPEANQPALVTDLKALLAKHGAAKALKVEKCFKPYPAFHTQRHILFSPEQNLEINRAMPLVTQIKTKEVQ